MSAVLNWEVSVPIKKQKDLKYFGNLKKEVIDSGLCSHCGTCVAICPVFGIQWADKPIAFPKWEEECIDDGVCVKFCPRVDYKPLKGVGNYAEVIAAKSKRFTGQDGGMVSEIMASALEMKMIDSAIVVERDDKWKPKVKVARGAKMLEDEKARGSKYSFADVLPSLRNAMKTAKKPGVVGTPCMVSGQRSLQKGVQLYKRVQLIVSIFCMENFYYNQLVKFLKGKGVEDLSQVKKMDITKGKFIVSMEENEVTFPVKEMDDIVPSGCKVCQDFTGVESDISVGSTGSDEGFSTVIVRTPAGKKVIDFIREKGTADFAEANIEIVEKSCNTKVKMHPYPKEG